jgi:hypothetical protein
MWIGQVGFALLFCFLNPANRKQRIEEIKSSLKRAFQQAKAGQRIPLEQMWEGIDAE